MKDSAYKNKGHLFIITIVIALLIFIPLYYSVNKFFLSSSDEIINLWYQSEKTSIQQGNILSSISKLQRPINRSILIKGIIVRDEYDHELLKMGSDFKINRNIHISNNGPQYIQMGFSSYIYHFSESGVFVYILVSSYLPYIITIGFAFYLIILFFIFGYFVRRESIIFEKLKSESKLESMRLKMALDHKFLILSKQVSHDIRSPLAALKMAVNEIENIPSVYQELIKSSVQRINDIANNLLQTDQNANSISAIKIELLAPLVDSIISEKRMQYRKNNNVEIVIDLSESYGLFANVNSVELKRVLSNLINNSVEAFSTKGEILIKISGTDDQILLTIKDNGKGIPESVLSKLGEAGLTHGKEGTESGSGLGIYHAKSAIESFEGSFKIESTVGVGTLIKINLPKAPSPTWFVAELKIGDAQDIFILDDDDSIHKFWKEKLQRKISSFTNGDEFAATIKKTQDKKILCLVDYELLGQSQTGLDIIEALGIADQAILVTSRFDEKEIRERALKLGVKMIPKTFASLVPIKIQNEQPFYEYVYIDDDELLRMGWERRAKKKNIKLLTLSSTSEFEKHIDQISREITHIYLDSSLGDNQISGEDFAKLLHEQGYKNLFIASGYEAKHFAHLPWLKFSGKDCPF